jgi:hypothetical protein
MAGWQKSCRTGLRCPLFPPLRPDHPLFEKFARLTKQEEDHGLLTDAAGIGTRAGWEARLTEAGFVLRGHRLCRRR